MCHRATLDSVRQIVRPQHSRRRYRDRPDFHDGQERLPKRHLVAEHYKDPVRSADSQGMKVIRDLTRPLRHLFEGKCVRITALVDHPQRKPCISARHFVEVIQSPIEFVQARPPKLAVGDVIVLPVEKKEITCLHKCRSANHNGAFSFCGLPSQACRAA